MKKVTLRRLTDPIYLRSEWFAELYPNKDPLDVLKYFTQITQMPETYLLGICNEKEELLGFVIGQLSSFDNTFFLSSILIDKKHRKNPKVLGAVLDVFRVDSLGIGFDSLILFTKKPNFFLKRGMIPFEEACLTFKRQSEESENEKPQ